jgi:hypothetical protein
MIPKWQMGLIFAAVGALLAAALTTSPYGHAVLSGACQSQWPPKECFRRGGWSVPHVRP